jgi:hypothetical protein
MPDRLVRVGLIVVVPEHRDRRHAGLPELAGQDGRFLHAAGLREISRQQEQVGVAREVPEVRRPQTARVSADVQVPHRRDADHLRRSGC